jgi:Zn-finger protein
MSMVVFISALPTSQAKMVTHKGIGHTAGRNAECLHYKCHEEKCQYKAGYQPLKDICDFSRSIFSSGLFGAVFLSLT